LGEGRPRTPASAELHSRVVGEYVAAVQAQDEAALLRLLAADARAISDGGGKARAALRVIESGRKVARFLCGIMRKNAGRVTIEPVVVNSEPGLLVRTGDHHVAAVSFEIREGRIAAIYLVVNPDKLRGVTPQAATGAVRW
jgi:RNA polymerase sigma-70 factor (ECF subfamily)